MVSIEYIKCPICHDEHEIDEYGWVQSCIGYVELYEVEDYAMEKVKILGRKET